MRCSRAQEALWLAEQVSEIGAANNMPLVVELRGELDVDALNTALAAVIKTQPALRTTFHRRGSRLEFDELEYSEMRVPALSVEFGTRPVDEIVAERSRVPLVLFGEPTTYSLLRASEDRHVLFAMFHHAVFDGLSKDLFVDDLAKAYAEASRGSTPRLPTRHGHQSYVRAERRHLESLAEAAGAHWRSVLPALPESATWPRSPHARPADEANGAALRFEIGAALKGRLERVARSHGVSLFVLLTAAVQVLQHVYAGRSEQHVATLLPMSTRPRQLSRAIGMFVNEAPLVTRPRDAERFSQFLRVVSVNVRALTRLRLFPFNEALARFGAGRDPRAMVPRIGISYWRTGAAEQTAGGVLFVPDRQASVYGRRWDVRFRFLAQPGVIAGGIEYDTAVLHTAGAERLATHLQTLLEHVSESPEVPLSAANVVPARETERLLHEWNATHAELGRRTLPQRFEEQVERRGDSDAVVSGDERISYRDLNARANRIAHGLVARGVGPGQIVAVRMERGIDLIAAMLAVSKSGAAFLPLDPSYPLERIDHMLRDSDAALVLTQANALAAAADDGNPRPRAVFDDPAYVIYTSGSTGRPKGVEVLHRGLANVLQSVVREPGLGATDTQVAVASVSFDLAILELFAPLVAGARVVIASAEEASDGAALAALLARHDATYLHATPTTWRLLVAAGWRGRLTAVSGAEAMTSTLARELLDRADRVWNSYGPTETTIASTQQRIESPSKISIGRPIANTRLLVMDVAGRPVPLGVPGELYIGGVGVARRYLNQPELTRERFVDEPVVGVPGRFYRSGDLVRQRDDGAIEYLRRMDDQIKIRGFRIEPAEVEAVLREHTRVREALVLAIDDHAGGKRLVAYITVDAEPRPTASELRSALAVRLPAHMIPNAFVTLDRFPVGGSGKVDRGRLPPPAPPLSQQTHVAPRNTTEATLASIWSTALGVDRLGVDDNFFELGGHSLIAAEVAAVASDALDRYVPVGLVFRHPTIAELASTLDAQSHLEDAGPMVPRLPRTPLAG